MSTATLTAPPRLRLTSLDEYEKIVHLESRNTLCGSMARGDWRDLLGEEPSLGSARQRLADGVRADADGRLVGSLVNIPSLYKYQGRDLIAPTAAAGSSLPNIAASPWR